MRKQDAAHMLVNLNVLRRSRPELVASLLKQRGESLRLRQRERSLHCSNSKRMFERLACALQHLYKYSNQINLKKQTPPFMGVFESYKT